MTSVARLVAWLAGQPMPDGPLCPCGRAAELTDDGVELCWPCLYRRADLAARPACFETAVLAGADTEHGDVVRLGTVDEVLDEHMHVTWMGLIRHQQTRRRLTWLWTGEWPTDDRTLEDILEARSLERLWGAA